MKLTKLVGLVYLVYLVELHRPSPKRAPFDASRTSTVAAAAEREHATSKGSTLALVVSLDLRLRLAIDG
jgi:hypothetical protein